MKEIASGAKNNYDTVCGGTINLWKYVVKVHATDYDQGVAKVSIRVTVFSECQTMN